MSSSPPKVSLKKRSRLAWRVLWTKFNLITMINSRHCCDFPRISWWLSRAKWLKLQALWHRTRTLRVFYKASTKVKQSAEITRINRSKMYKPSESMVRHLKSTSMCYRVQTQAAAIPNKALLYLKMVQRRLRRGVASTRRLSSTAVTQWSLIH